MNYLSVKFYVVLQGLFIQIVINKFQLMVHKNGVPIVMYFVIYVNNYNI